MEDEFIILKQRKSFSYSIIITSQSKKDFFWIYLKSAKNIIIDLHTKRKLKINLNYKIIFFILFVSLVACSQREMIVKDSYIIINTSTDNNKYLTNI